MKFNIKINLPIFLIGQKKDFIKFILIIWYLFKNIIYFKYIMKKF